MASHALLSVTSCLECLRHLILFDFFDDIDHSLIFVMCLLRWLSYDLGDLTLEVGRRDYFEKEEHPLENVACHLFDRRS